jgi:ribosomal protein L37E
MSRFVDDGAGIVWTAPAKTKKDKYKCFDCGKSFPESYLMLLHYDFHRGEPTVREAGCFCAQTYDVRVGTCAHCGYKHSNGWRVVNGVAVGE